MILKYSDEKFNTKTYIFLQCDKCGKEQRRFNIKYLKLKENPAFDLDYCEKCWCGIRQKTNSHKEKMSKAINDMIDSNPEWKDKISQTSKGKINLGENNGMKNPEAREKASKTRKEMMKNGYNKKVAEMTKKAWADGKYEGVNVGICKWHEYLHSNGKTYKVQGTWELLFIKWLDESNMKFDCHRGRLEYELNKTIHNYYPDFYVHDWNCYVDIKNDYHYSISKDKFDALEKAGHIIKLLFKKDIEKLTNTKLL